MTYPSGSAASPGRVEETRVEEDDRFDGAASSTWGTDAVARGRGHHNGDGVVGGLLQYKN